MKLASVAYKTFNTCTVLRQNTIIYQLQALHLHLILNLLIILRPMVNIREHPP